MAFTRTLSDRGGLPITSGRSSPPFSTPCTGLLMTVFDTKHQRAAWLVAILGVVLVIALLPYVSGLLGAPVLYVVFGRLHRRIARWTRSRALAALIVILIALVSVILPL